MLHGHSSCQTGQHTAKPGGGADDCPACAAAEGEGGGMCSRHATPAEHALRWRVGEPVLFYPPFGADGQPPQELQDALKVSG